MEFSELFTQSVREVLPLVRQKALVYYLDFDGAYFELAGEHAVLRAGTHRLLRGLIDCFETGFLVFTSAVACGTDGRWKATLHLAGAGATACFSSIAEVLARLQLEAGPEAAHGSSGAMRISGVCPATGGQVKFAYAGHEGIFISLTVDVEGEEVPGPSPLPDAEGVIAFTVSEVPGGLDSVARRLRRLGWQVAEFGALDQAIHRLALDRSSGQTLPLLLLVAEVDGQELAALEPVSRALPATRVVLAVLAGSSTLDARAHSPVDIRPLPLSPRDLERLTQHVDALTSTPESRETSPMPLYVHDARRVLVVDDSDVNQFIARGQLELLGYDVTVATNGREALQLCRERAPDVVLMDMDMPELDGVQTTQHLRAWQQVGIVPPFPIVASTSGEDVDRRRAECLAAGMDGYLAKPMDLRRLADEIHRVLPERAAERPGAAP
ncbi:response regulator [Ideonella sp.]|uniref:response regulator n=1 Tax=Ideonella sp. TaxID=1929293 RepID=UPI0035AE5168